MALDCNGRAHFVVGWVDDNGNFAEHVNTSEEYNIISFDPLSQVPTTYVDYMVDDCLDGPTSIKMVPLASFDVDDGSCNPTVDCDVKAHFEVWIEDGSLDVSNAEAWGYVYGTTQWDHFDGASIGSDSSSDFFLSDVTEGSGGGEGDTYYNLGVTTDECGMERVLTVPVKNSEGEQVIENDCVLVVQISARCERCP